jgi:steroid delta-isomerase-like uncharacterized protein
MSRIVADNTLMDSLRQDELKSRILTCWEGIWNEGLISAADDLMCVNYQRTVRDRAPLNKEEFKQTVQSVRSAFPDLCLTVESMVREGSVVVTRWNVTGTQEGVILGTPATFLPVNIAGVTWTEFEGNCVAREWLSWDAQDMLKVLGIITIGSVD